MVWTNIYSGARDASISAQPSFAFTQQWDSWSVLLNSYCCGDFVCHVTCILVENYAYYFWARGERSTMGWDAEWIWLWDLLGDCVFKPSWAGNSWWPPQTLQIGAYLCTEIRARGHQQTDPVGDILAHGEGVGTKWTQSVVGFYVHSMILFLYTFISEELGITQAKIIFKS